MSEATLRVGGIFLPGTTVGAYEQWDEGPPQSPPGAAVETSVVGTDGMVTFDDVPSGVALRAAAQVGGTWRSLTFYAGADIGASPEGVSQAELDQLQATTSAALAAHAADDTKHSRPLVYNIKDYGASPLVADNVAAAQEAIDAAEASGNGGVIWRPEGDYPLTSVTNADGIKYQLLISGDNITFAGPGRLIADPGENITAVIAVMGWAKNHPAAEWADHYWYAQDYADIADPIDKGATTLTLATPADAADYSPGDAIKVFTGALGRINTPDSELNEVVSADEITGEVVLRWPTVKSYEQEWTDTEPVFGEAGLHSHRDTTAYPAPFAIANVEDTVIRNVGVDARVESLSAGTGCEAVRYYSVIGLDVEIDAEGSLGGPVDGHDARFFYFKPKFVGDEIYAIYGCSTGCSDGFMDHPDITSTISEPTLELSEGCSAIVVDSPTHRASPDAATDLRAISAGTRNRDVRILNPHIVNHATGVAILCQQDADGEAPECDGNIVVNPRVEGDVTRAGRVIGRGWQVIGDLSTRDNPITVNGSDHSDGQPTEVVSLNGQVGFADNNEEIYLGTIPKHAKIVGVEVERLAIFNGTTNRLDIGWLPSSSQAIVNNADVAGSYTGPLPIPVAFVGKLTAAREVIATFRSAGTPASAGSVVITVRYIPSRMDPNA